MITDSENNGTEYGKLSDERLAAEAQQGDGAAEQALVLRYMGLVRLKARPYFLVGADKADLIQEGSIGLFGAIRDFDTGKKISFRSFAEVCIGNQIISAIKRSTRKKHLPLNNYVSLDKTLFNNGNETQQTLGDSIPANTITTDPEELIINRESANTLIGGLQGCLTELEKNVLTLFTDGKSYAEIAGRIGRSPKTVDNALQRIKKKLLKLMNEQNSTR